MTKRNNKKLIIKILGATAAIVGSFSVCASLALTSKVSQFVDYDSASKSISYASDWYAEDGEMLKTMWNSEQFAGYDNPNDTFYGNIKASDPTEANLYTGQTDSSAKSKYAAVVCDGASHQILDKSFNQSGYLAEVQWAWTSQWYGKHINDEYTGLNENVDPTNTSNIDNPVEGTGRGAKPISDNVNDFWQTYNNMLDKGVKAIILPGYLHAGAFDNFFKDTNKSEYEKGRYILLDSSYQSDYVASVLFRSDQSAMMAGIATCQYLNDNFDEYIKDGSLAVGTFGGMAIPSVTIYMGGFQYGVQIWNENINTICKNHDAQYPNEKKWVGDEERHKVKFINLGNQDSFFTNSFAAGDGTPTAQYLLQKGADAILPVAGPQTSDAVREIQSEGSHSIVIGVDTAQELDTSTNKTYRDGFKDKNGDDNIIKFSAEKNIAKITSQILSLMYAGLGFDNQKLDADGNPYTAQTGWLTVADIDNGGAQSSDASLPYLTEYCKLIAPDLTVATPTITDIIKLWRDNPTIFKCDDGEGYFDSLKQTNHMEFRF